MSWILGQPSILAQEFDPIRGRSLRLQIAAGSDYLTFFHLTKRDQRDCCLKSSRSSPPWAGRETLSWSGSEPERPISSLPCWSVSECLRLASGLTLLRQRRWTFSDRRRCRILSS